MSDYVLIYYGDPKFSTPEEANQNRAKWEAWADGLGDALVNRGIPIGMPKTVSASGIVDGMRPERVTGFTMVKADSLDEAVEMAKGCPYLDFGTIDVAETFAM